MSLMMSEGKYVGRNEIATVPTPTGTTSWKPVPHMDVIDAVTEAVKAKNWQILDEQYGLAREGQRMFGAYILSPSSTWLQSRVRRRALVRLWGLKGLQGSSSVRFYLSRSDR